MLTWFSFNCQVQIVDPYWGEKTARVKSIFDNMSTSQKRFSAHFVNRQEDAFNYALSLQISLQLSQTKWNCTGTGFSFSVLCNNAVYFSLFSHRFILQLYFALFSRHQNPILSGDRNSGFWFATCALSMLSQSNIQSWSGPPKSVIVGIKQIKIDFYSARIRFYWDNGGLVSVQQTCGHLYPAPLSIWIHAPQISARDLLIFLYLE